MRFIFVCLFLGFLAFPYLILLPKFSFFTFIDQKEFFEAFQNSTLQALGSSLAVLGLGILGAQGLLAVPRRLKKTVTLIFLVPSFLPILYILTSAFHLIKPFPFGLSGIVLMHALVFSGFTSVLFCEIFQEKLSGFSELALIEGASRFRFLLSGLRYISRDISYIFLSLFIIFFTSFSIPLVVGKNTLIVETLVYEKVKVFGEYGHGLAFTLIQSGFLLIFAFFLRPLQASQRPSGFRNLTLLKIPLLFLPFAFIFSTIALTPLFKIGVEVSLKDWMYIAWNARDLAGQAYTMTLHTLLISLGVASVIYGLSFLSVILSKSKIFRTVLMSYVVPSTALVGFSLIVVNIPSWGTYQNIIKSILGLSLLMFPMLYRFKILNDFDSLQNQVDVAQTMGASSRLIFFRVLAPQVHKSICFCAGVSGFWAASDFALNSFLFLKEETWSLFIYSLLGSYRLDMASTYLLIPIFLGALVYFFFQGLYYVMHSKSY